MPSTTWYHMCVSAEFQRFPRHDSIHGTWQFCWKPSKRQETFKFVSLLRLRPTPTRVPRGCRRCWSGWSMWRWKLVTDSNFKTIKPSTILVHIGEFTILVNIGKYWWVTYIVLNMFLLILEQIRANAMLIGPRFSRVSNDVVVLCPSCPKPGTCVACRGKWWAKIIKARVESDRNDGGLNCWLRLGIITLHSYTHMYMYRWYNIHIYTHILQSYAESWEMHLFGNLRILQRNDAQISGRSR